MKQYRCSVCGYIYEEAKGIPDQGIAPGTKWEDIPDDFVCPECGASKDEFELIQNNRQTQKQPVCIAPCNCINRLFFIYYELIRSD